MTSYTLNPTENKGIKLGIFFFPNKSVSSIQQYLKLVTVIFKILGGEI